MGSDDLFKRRKQKPNADLIQIEKSQNGSSPNKVIEREDKSTLFGNQPFVG